MFNILTELLSEYSQLLLLILLYTVHDVSLAYSMYHLSPSSHLADIAESYPFNAVYRVTYAGQLLSLYNNMSSNFR